MQDVGGGRDRAPLDDRDPVRRWEAGVFKRPFSSTWGCLLLLALGSVALLVFGGMIYIGATARTQPPKFVWVVVALAGFFVVLVFRAILLPLAYHLHVATESGPRGARTSRIVAVVLVVGVVAAVIAVFKMRASASRLDAVKEAWGPAREALAAGDILKFDRRWDALAIAAASTKRTHPDLAAEVDAYVRDADAESERLLAEAWPRIEARIDGPKALRALARNEALRDAPDFGERMRRLGLDLRARGVLADVRVERSTDSDEWRDEILDDLRAALPEALLYTAWPLEEPPPADAPAVRVMAGVGAAVLGDAPQGKARIVVPTQMVLFVSVEGEPRGCELPTGSIVLGPLPIEDPRYAAAKREFNVTNIPVLFSAEEAHALCNANRLRLKEMLRAALTAHGVSANPASSEPLPDPAERERGR